MKTIQGKIDDNDLAYVLARFGEPELAKPCPIKKNKISPNATRFLLKDGRLIDVFHIKPIYYEASDGTWHPMSEISYGFGNRWIHLKPEWEGKMSVGYLRWLLKRMDLINGNMLIPSPNKFHDSLIPVSLRNFNFTTSTFYPDPNPESTSVDGGASRNSVDEAFATIRAGAGNDSGDSGATTVAGGLKAAATSNQWVAIYRGFFLFDTSSIPDTDTISSATFSLYGNSGLTGNEFGTAPELDVVSSTPASNTAIVNADYSQVGSTVFGSATWANVDQTAYFDITLDANGIANISKTGVSKFGTRQNWDTDNSPPTWSSGGPAAYGYVQCADTAGTGNDPKLVVVHAAGGGSAVYHRLGLLGVGM